MCIRDRGASSVRSASSVPGTGSAASGREASGCGASGSGIAHLRRLVARAAPAYEVDAEQHHEDAEQTAHDPLRRAGVGLSLIHISEPTRTY